ncbi:anapc4 [Nephila pilipes]|uniref:Anapc4 n=1 Tax=Nephila pilipes TaxID=299642 RepID=A0A8X6IN53_NEPPI|nr:anapc4 [Nephila pilipes]GFT93488.1 anapc4 [Nephila pilipes]
MYSDLREVIDAAVKGPWTVLKETVHEQNLHTLSEKNKVRSPPKISHFYCTETNYLYTVITNSAPPCSHFYLIREKSTESKSNGVEVIGVRFCCADNESSIPSTSFCMETETNFQISDLKFFSKDTITVLLLEDNLGDKNSPYLFHYSIKSLLSQLKSVKGGTDQPLGQDIPILEVCPFSELNYCKRLEGTKALQLVVTGSRKVSCVLFSTKSLVRLYEMDADEEEEEEETEHEESMKDARKDDMLSDEEVEIDKPDKV